MEADRDDKDPMDLSTRPTESPSQEAVINVSSPAATAPLAPTNAAELEMVNFPCHTCGEMFSSRAKQEQHVSERHSRFDRLQIRHNGSKVQLVYC